MGKTKDDRPVFRQLWNSQSYKLFESRDEYVSKTDAYGNKIGIEAPKRPLFVAMLEKREPPAIETKHINMVCLDRAYSLDEEWVLLEHQSNIPTIAPRMWHIEFTSGDLSQFPQGSMWPIQFLWDAYSVRHTETLEDGSAIVEFLVPQAILHMPIGVRCQFVGTDLYAIFTEPVLKEWPKGYMEDR